MACTCADYDKTPWSEFFPYMSIYLDRIPEDIASFLVRAAVIEWATETLMLQRDVYIDVQSCVSDYTVEVPDGFTLHSIREAYFKGSRLTPVQRIGSYGVHHGQVYFDGINQIMLGDAPAEDEKGALLVRAIVLPTQQSCEIDSWVFQRYAEQMANGGLSRAFLMNGTPWASPREGGIMLRRWQTFMGRVKSERVKGGIAGPTFIKVPRFV